MTTGNLWAKGGGAGTAQFLKLNPSGRGLAMGNAQTASVDDVLSSFWNPAAVSKITQTELALSHRNLYSDANHDTILFSQPTHQKGTFSLGGAFMQINKIEGYDEHDNPTTDVSASDKLAILGWSRSWTNFLLLPGLHTGVSLKLYQKTLGDQSAMTYPLDAGCLYEIQEGFLEKMNVGLTLQNFGPGMKFVAESQSLPSSVGLGLSYPFFSNSLVGAIDVIAPADNATCLNAGLDYRINPTFAIRVGYQGQYDVDTGLTCGFGIGNKRLHLDYAFIPAGDLGGIHSVSLSFRFGQAFRRSQVLSQIRQAYENAERSYVEGRLLDASVQLTQIIEVAPWHRPSKSLLQKIKNEYNDPRSPEKKEQAQLQIDEHFTKGVAFYQQDEFILAKREFETILTLQPDHASSKTYLDHINQQFRDSIQRFYEIGMNHFAANQFKEAKEYFEKVLTIDPAHAEAKEQLTRAVKLSSEKKSRQRDQIDLSPARAQYATALSAFEKRQYELAVEKFREVLQIDPENKEAQRYRALSIDLVSQSAFEQASKAAQSGDWEKAKELYEKTLSYRPDFTEASTALEKVKNQLGENTKVTSQKYYREGLKGFLAGDKQKAVELWQKAVELDPTNVEAKRGLDRILKKPTPQ